MEKYKLLKLLSKIISFTAWLSLILSTIVIIYNLIYKEAELIEILGSTIGSIIGGIYSFILLLGFGKFIQIILDIREDQIKISDEMNSHKPNESKKQVQKIQSKPNKREVQKKIDVDDNLISELKNLIIKQEESLNANKYKKDIILLLNRIITSQDQSRGLIEQYYNLYESNLLDDLKNLTNNYKSIKEYVFIFIDFDIIEEEYPHELKE